MRWHEIILETAEVAVDKDKNVGLYLANVRIYDVWSLTRTS